MLNAAVDDDVIAKNPCLASSVRRPKRAQSKIEPWSVERVARVAEELPERYRIVAVLGAGLGLRQGEIFGLSPDDVDFLRGSVEVRRQVRVHSDGSLEFNLPKGRKIRTVPLPVVVREALAAHLAAFPAEVVSLPWGAKDGPLTPVELVVSSRERKAMNRNYFNAHIWKPALGAAGVPTGRENGCHALRHHFASVLLDGGESIKALSEYLGHADAGFTLRTYTHLMPSSHERTRRAIDAAWSRVTGVSSAVI
jgi:integrase